MFYEVPAASFGKARELAAVCATHPFNSIPASYIEADMPFFVQDVSRYEISSFNVSVVTV